MRNNLIIAIDGPSGAGKSTAARILAQRLGYIYIDTGAMYRSLGWKARKERIDPADENALADLCLRTDVAIRKGDDGPRFTVDGIDVTNELRTPEMGMMASAVSKSPAIRARLLTLQRELGKDGGVVMDGRDIGTVVFPDADLKFFLEASEEERGKRRYLELKTAGMDVDLARILREIRDRDCQDRGRSIAPLRKADNALLIDSSLLTIDEVVEKMLSSIPGAK
jgi:cytidylate kinase